MTIYNFDLAAPFARNAPSDQIEPFPDLDTGLGIAFTQSDGKPEMKGLNGLFQLLTVSILSLRQRGISLWVASEEYPAGSFSVEGSKLYQAKTTNTGKRPSTSQNDWMIFASISDIKVSTNGNLKKEVAADGGVTLTVPTATTEDRGVMRFANPTEAANQTNVSAAIVPSDVKRMFSQSIASDGWCKLPNGLILQWGNVSAGVTTKNFPIPFPNNVFHFSVQLKGVLGVGDDWNSTSGKANSKTQFSCFVEGYPGNWFAIGN